MGKSARRTIFGALFGMLVALLLVPGTALAANGHDMYRLYNQWTGEHFYTALASERDSLKGVGWTYEGVGWVAPDSGEDVYRLYNGYVKGGDHHYTMNKTERDALVAIGWTNEGVGWKSGGTVKLYREYNPYATTGTHNYTTDKAEHDALIKEGWRSEGTAWYGVDSGRPVTPTPAPAPSAPSPSTGSGSSSSGSGQAQQPQPQQPQQQEPQANVVYWTPGGKVYHSTRNCPSLSRSRNVLSGSVADAQSAGKSRPCKNCF